MGTTKANRGTQTDLLQQIVTGDKMRVHHYERSSKDEGMEWKHHISTDK